MGQKSMTGLLNYETPIFRTINLLFEMTQLSSSNATQLLNLRSGPAQRTPRCSPHLPGDLSLWADGQMASGISGVAPGPVAPDFNSTLFTRNHILLKEPL